MGDVVFGSWPASGDAELVRFMREFADEALEGGGFDLDRDVVVVDPRSFSEWWADVVKTAPASCVDCGGRWLEVETFDGEEWIGSDESGAYAEGYGMQLFCADEECDGVWEVELVTKRVRHQV